MKDKFMALMVKINRQKVRRMAERIRYMDNMWNCQQKSVSYSVGVIEFNLN